MTQHDQQLRPLLTVKHLVVTFTAGPRVTIDAVSDVSFEIHEGETLGLVGESGCGKTTVARAIVQLQKPTGGKILMNGTDLVQCGRSELRRLRPKLQMIFQDATASLNPGRKIGKSIGEPLRVVDRLDQARRNARVRELMLDVGLDPELGFDRYPHEFSGGQCQRISIARALISQPRLLICDEPVSSLDVSVQAQILNLLEDMKARYGLTMLFISHDLAVVKNICDRVAVMYLGKLCEIASGEALYRSPRHPYSAALLASIPNPDHLRPPEPARLSSVEMPSPSNPPSGCRFRTRCPRAQALCAKQEPLLEGSTAHRQVACHFPLDR
jgi:peptide/nickel transport system ATP-binding protein